MKLRGVVRTAELQENPSSTDQVEMLLKVQGVGPGQPRSVVIPYSLLLSNESLDAEALTGRGFEAEVGQDEAGRWIVSEIAFASKVLRPDG